jgi:hypothetical protein
MQGPTGRTILTVPSTGTSSKPEEPRPAADNIIKPVPGCRSALWVASGRRSPGRPARLARRSVSLRCVFVCRCRPHPGCDSCHDAMVRRQRARVCGVVGNQAGSGEAVVLIFGDQMPGEHGELAGGGDDCGLEAAAGFDALVERPQRPGRSAPTMGVNRFAIASLLPVASNATSSSRRRSPAHCRKAAGVTAIRPWSRTRPSSTTASWANSRCTSIPI